MKIYHASDIHLEFGRGELKIPTGDVLLLPGDICLPWAHRFRLPDRSTRNINAKTMKRAEKFFKECSSKFSKVFMVLGNHEHYHGTFSKSMGQLQHQLDMWNCGNVELMENDVAEFGDYTLFGATFWTDMYGADPIVQLDVECGINDYRYIWDDDDAPIRSRMTCSENKYSRGKLVEFFKNLPVGRKPIVMTHHAPFFLSVPQRYKLDSVSFGYANSKIEYLIDPYAIPPTTWLHGHTHDRFRYSIGNIEVVCHPRGYWGELGSKQYEFGLLNDHVTVEVV